MDLVHPRSNGFNVAMINSLDDEVISGEMQHCVGCICTALKPDLQPDHIRGEY